MKWSLALCSHAAQETCFDMAGEWVSMLPHLRCQPSNMCKSAAWAVCVQTHYHACIIR